MALRLPAAIGEIWSWNVGAKEDQWRGYDRPLLGLMCAILILGLIVLSSAAHAAPGLVANQVLHAALGLACVLIIRHINPRLIHFWTPFAYGALVFLLVLVVMVGDVVNGSRRWLSIAGLNMQPSEFMKIALPAMLAWIFAEQRMRLGFRQIGAKSVLILVPVALVVMQPDLGTGAILLMVGAAVIVLAGLSLRFIISAAVLGLFSAPLLWFQLKDYQQLRILTLFDPERDPQGAGWHIIQSTTAIGSGGLFGKGFRQGTQSNLEFLPERHNDFIAAVIGEEFGLLGLLVLLVLYLLLLGRCFYISIQLEGAYQKLTVAGIATGLFVCVFVNLMMVCGFLPVVGVPLPLVSYGGTSMLATLIGLGIILSFYANRK